MPQQSLGELFTSALGNVPSQEDVNSKYEKPASGIPASDLASGVIPDTSVLAPKASPVFTSSISLGRRANTTIGTNSVAEGDNTTASGGYSHAEGSYTTASGNQSHAEGQGTTASGGQSHAEGSGSRATNTDTHAEGQGTHAGGYFSHAEGGGAQALGSGSHAEGSGTQALGTSSHAEGGGTQALGNSSHAEGNNTIASGISSHAEGNTTTAIGAYEHVSGRYNILDSALAWTASTSYEVNDLVQRTETFTDDSGTQRTRTVIYKCKIANSDATFTLSKWEENGLYVEIIGNGTYNARSNARALDWDGNEYLKGDLYVGCNADSTGGAKVATTADTSLLAPKASPEFTGSISLGRKASTTVGTASTALGDTVEASGNYSHAEGYNTRATSEEAHAEGIDTEALSQAAHAEGRSARATAYVAHAEGYATNATGSYSHAEGNTTTANHKAQHAGGEFNVLDASVAAANERGDYVEIIGNGTGTSARSNARALDWSGNEYLNGDLYVGCNADSTGGAKVLTASDLPDTSSLAPKASPVFTGSISLGRKTNTSIGTDSTAIGRETTASGNYSHAEGYTTSAEDNYAHAEGSSTYARGNASHSEGTSTIAVGPYSHAEGEGSKSLASTSHAEGGFTIASGKYTHVLGKYNVFDIGIDASEWTAGTSYNVNDLVYIYSGAYQGNYKCKTANSDSTFSPSKWYSYNNTPKVEIVGNGTDNNTRSNARALDWNGNEYLMGDIYVGCNADSTGGTKLTSVTEMTVAESNTMFDEVFGDYIYAQS